MFPILAGVLDTVVRLSLQAAVLIVVILLVQWLFRHRLPPRWRYDLWLLVVVRLLLPLSPQSALSVFNVAQLASVTVHPVPRSQFVQMNGKVISPAIPLPPAGPVTNWSLGADSPADMLPPALPGRSAVSPPGFVQIVPGQRYNWGDLLLRLWLSLYARATVSVWLAGMAVLTLQIAWTTARALLRVRRATPISDPAVISLFEACRREMRVPAPILLRETPFVRSPALFGVVRPRLLLPPGLTGHFALAELRYVFLHELAHVKRRDVAMNWLLTLLQVIHWFNPVIWLGFARLRADRELACDALAMSCSGENEARSYGLTIIKLLETFSRASSFPGLVGIMENKGEMARRLRLIANFRQSRRWSLLAVALLAVLAVTGLTDGVRSTLADPPKAGPSKPLRVTVLDAETGQPISGASIIAGYNRNVTFNGPPPLFRTDSAGVAILPNMGAYNLGMGVFAPDYAPRAVEWVWFGGQPPPVLPSEYTIHLGRGVALGGTLQDEAGRPLANVHVAIRGICDPRKDNEVPKVLEEYPFYDPAFNAGATTDAQGHWSCAHFSPEMEVLQLDFQRADGAFRRFHNSLAPWKYPPMGGGIIDLAAAERGDLLCVFGPGTDVRGQVRNVAGEPLSDIRLAETDRRHPNVTVSVSQTDAAGRFTLPDRDPHQLQLTLSGPGLAINAQIVTVAPGMPELSLTMHPAAGLKVRTVDQAGAPIAGAEIRAFDPALEWVGTTDPAGRAAWAQAPVEPEVYGLSAPGYGSHSVRLAATGTEQQVVLRRGDPPGTIFTIKAVDESGHPLKTFALGVAYNTMGQGMNDFDAPKTIANGADGLCEAVVPMQNGGGLSYRLQITSPDLEPYMSEPLRDGPDRELSVTLHSASDARLNLRLPDGQPAAGASVVCSDAPPGGRSWISLMLMGGGQPRVEGDHTKRARADDAGDVLLPDVSAEAAVVVADKKGYLITTAAALRQAREVSLLPWGKLEGTLTINDRPQAGQRLMLQPDRQTIPEQVSFQYFVTTGANGHFAFDQVPAGNWTLYCTQPSQGTWPMNHPAAVEIQAGQTTRLAYGGGGRTVTGKFQVVPADAAIDWKKDLGTCLLSHREDQPPATFEGPDYQDYLRQDDLNDAYRKALSRPRPTRAEDTFQPEIDENGNFRIGGVPPGSYTLEVELVRSTLEGRQWNNTRLGTLKRSVIVPPAPVEHPEVPAELGTVDLPVNAGLLPKRTEVAFTAQAFDGQPVKLSEYRGKHVLLNFWASWAPPTVAQMAQWKTLAAAYAPDPHFVIVNVSLDDDPAAAGQFAQTNALPGIQTRLEGGAKTKVTEALEIDTLPASLIVDPDGRLGARDLTGARLPAAIAAALAAAP
jgi:beta-lactamase regulating signal transducer with metallopeptidase domain/thiol-disulfide isomerase/thioredoxin